jgi:hypothetical protein
MHTISHHLAEAISDRIGAIVPPPLAVQAEGSSVNLYVNSKFWGGSAAAEIIEDVDGSTFSERLERAAIAILSGIQDCTAEYLTLPWPVDEGGEMAMPGARADIHRLYLWYGSSEDTALLTLRPIEFAELLGP